MKWDFTEANEDNQEKMFHSGLFVPFVSFCRGLIDFLS
jgi:hypothetical protein